MNSVQQKIASLDQKQLKAFFQEGILEILIEGERLSLTTEDVTVERQVLKDLVAEVSQEITVALDTTLTEALLLEGLARELVNKINTMRRDGGYAVTDRILVTLHTSERLREAFHLHQEYICHEVLASEVLFEKCEGTAWDLNGEPATISFIKA